MTISIRTAVAALGLALLTAAPAVAQTGGASTADAASTGGVAAFSEVDAAKAASAGKPAREAGPALRPKVRALLERIARCESGGDPTAVSPDGRYRGKYQFAVATWRAIGGKGDPAAAPEAVQDRLAAKLLRVQGRSAWPVCAA